MVLVKGFRGQTVILLTSMPINSPKDLWLIISAYMKPWSIEETMRFIKQTYDLENIRVFKYARLQTGT